MPPVSLVLLGGFAVHLDSGEPCVLPTRKAQALLAYLAMPVGRSHSREKLTALLWGDAPEAQARQNLRQTLTRLRRALGDAVLVAQHDTVALQARMVSVDVADLEVALRDGAVTALEHAATLYKGDFLDGFSVDEAPFEEWRVVERERLHELALEGLARLLREHMRAEQTELATRTALKILALDPLQESVHRTVMRLLARQGRRAAALQQYQVCVGWLERELGVEPEEETRTLYRELLQGSTTSRDSGRQISDRRGHQAPSGLMVGRRDQMTALQHALEQTLDQGGRIVVVAGEAGIGKTRLIQEFTAEAAARGLRILTAWCHETEQPLPFRPWIDALRGTGPALQSMVRGGMSATARASLARVFPELASVDDKPAATTTDEHAVLFEALSELVRQAAKETPVVIVLEDLHWADAMSTRLLAFLGRRLGALPVLIVGSLRTEDVAETSVLERVLDELRAGSALHEIPLSTLSRDDSVALAGALHAGGKRRTSQGPIAEAVWTLSEGNPFVIVETVRAFKEEDAGASGSIPRGVRQFVAARLARLSEPARRVLSAAAVIGRACSFKLLAQSAGVSEMNGATAIEELVRRRVLEIVGDRLVICHDRIRQVAYDDLGPARRIALHGAVGHALETLRAGDLDEVANELGHHALKAGDVERALVYLERFAEIATRRYALEAAIDARRQALEAAKQLPSSIRDRRQLEIGVRQGFVFSLAARHRDALDLLQAHVPLLQRVGDPALASDHYFRLAIATQFFGHHAEGRAAAQAAIQEAERARDDERLGKGFYVLSMMNVVLGEISRSIAHAERATMLLETEATRHWLALTYWVLTWAHTVRGTLDAAEESGERCASIARDMGDRRLQVFAAYITALIHVARGDAVRGLEYARRAKEAAVDPVSASVGLLALGYAHLEQANARGAIDALEELLKGPAALVTRARALALLSEAYGAVGETAAGTDAARWALAEAQTHGAPIVAGLAERALGRIARGSGDPARGEEHFARALEQFLTGEAELEAALTRMDLARVLASRGADRDAREHLAHAMSVFTAARAPRRVAGVQELARQLGIGLAAAS